MEATLIKPGEFAEGRPAGVVLGTVGLAVASAIAWGVFHLLQADEEPAASEPDETTYLLREPNGEALRASIRRRGQGRYVAYNPLDA